MEERGKSGGKGMGETGGMGGGGGVKGRELEDGGGGSFVAALLRVQQYTLGWGSSSKCRKTNMQDL